MTTSSSPLNKVSSPRRNVVLAMAALFAGSFGIGMTEFVGMGLLPEIAADFIPEIWSRSQEQAIAQAGMLITVYALGVVVGAPTLSGFFARYPRHRVLMILAAMLTIGNGAVLIAPTFEWAVLSRFFAGLPHGAFFGMAALVAADLLGPARRAQGVALALLGLTVANVVGVPLGTFLGQTWGWQIAFVLVTVLFMLTLVLIVLFIPKSSATMERTFRAELKVFRIGQVWAALAIGSIGFGGFFAVYTYVAPLVTDITGMPQTTVSIVLIVMGLGMTVGNLLGGRLADAHLQRTMLGAMLMLMLTLCFLALTAHWPPTLFLGIFLVGCSASMTSPTIQTRLMDVAGDNQAIAAALNHSALNLGNSMGAFLGGMVIAAGWGYLAPVWLGAVLALIGLALVWLSFKASARK